MNLDKYSLDKFLQKKKFLIVTIKNFTFKYTKCVLYSIWGEMWESNPRITEPQSAVLTTSPIPPGPCISRISKNGKKIKSLCMII